MMPMLSKSEVSFTGNQTVRRQAKCFSFSSGIYKVNGTETGTVKDEDLAKLRNKQFGFADGNILGMTIHVDSLQLEVIGILEPRGATGSGRNADEVVLVTEPVFNRLFQPDGYSTVTVIVNDITQLESISQQAIAMC
jgi:hypothetical protein